jgi:hypothetical protein
MQTELAQIEDLNEDLGSENLRLVFRAVRNGGVWFWECIYEDGVDLME